MKLKVGDRVRIREDLAVGMHIDSIVDYYVAEEMLLYSGKVAFITEVLLKENSYRIDCDNSKWCWTDTELILLPMTNADYFRMISDVELAKIISSGEWSCICPMCKYNGTESCIYDEDDEVVHTKDQCIKGILEWLKQSYEFL